MSCENNKIVVNYNNVIKEYIIQRDGWTPVFSVVPFADGSVMQLVDYTGGEGEKPTANIGWYLGASGYVENIGDASILGIQGEKGDPGEPGVQGIQGEPGFDGWTPIHEFEADGVQRQVKKLVDYIGGTGDKPTDNIGQYVIDGGYTTDKSLATNFKGAEGTANGLVEEGNTQAVSGGEVYQNIKTLPEIVEEYNIFNKDNAVEGQLSISAGKLIINPSTVYDTAYIIVKGKSKVTLTGVRILYFSDFDKNRINTAGDGTILESQTHTFDIPSGAYYLAVAVRKTNLDIANIVFGDELKPYRPYSFDIEYNGVNADNVRNILVTDTLSLERGTISGGVQVGSRNSLLLKYPLKEGVFYEISSISEGLIINNVFAEDTNGIISAKGASVTGITGSEEAVFLYLVVRKTDSSNFENHELDKYSTTIKYYLSEVEYRELNKADNIQCDDNILYQLSIDELELEIKNTRDEIALLESNAEPLYSIKEHSDNDTQTIPLAHSNGGKFILNFHRRANDGFNTLNDAYLPNSKKDFSDVRVSSGGKTLGYKTIYSGNIDIISDSRVIDGSQIYKDSFGVIYGRKVGQGIVKSTDGILNEELPVFSDIQSPTVMTITSDNTLLVGSQGKIYRSEYPYSTKTMVFDVSVYTGYDTSILSHSTVQHPDGELFYGTYQGERDSRIFKSTDDGITWVENLRVDDTYQHFHNLSIDLNQTPVAIYAGMDGGGGVYKSVDKGISWVDLRALYPDMPWATDYGVIYSEPTFRLLGGETSITEGYSILRTTNDQTFEPVLANGKAVYFVQKLGGKLFAGELSSRDYRTTSIVMSEDKGLSWKTVYTTALQIDTGASDGFRYLSKPFSDQIIVGCQSGTNTKQPLRIFEGGDNYYSQVIVDVPAGVSELTVESGYIASKEVLMYNESKEKDVIFYAPLNEDREYLHYYIDGQKKLIRKDFDFVENGKKLGSIFPPIVKNIDDKSAIIKPGDFLAVENMDLSNSNFHISFWWDNYSLLASTLELLTGGGTTISIVNQYQLRINGVVAGAFNLIKSFSKVDINFMPNGRVEIYVNGIYRGESSSSYTSQISQLKGDIAILSSPIYTQSSVEEHNIQHFTIGSGNVTEAEALNGYYNGLFDNM